MITHRIVITQISNSAPQAPELEFDKSAESQPAVARPAPSTEREVFRQEIEGLDLRKFVRTVNATPRKSRAKKTASTS